MTDTRKLDALVAEHLMELSLEELCNPDGKLVAYVKPGGTDYFVLPRYLENLTAAFEVIEKVGGRIAKTHTMCAHAWSAHLGDARTGEGQTWQEAWRRCVEAYLRSKGVALDHD